MDRRTAMSAPVEQAVARPPDGFERRGRKTLLQLAAQPSDIDVDDIGLRVERHVPHVARQHLARHHLARIFHEIAEQSELAQAERKVPVLAKGGQSLHMAFDSAIAYPRDMLAPRGPAAERAEP